MRSDSMPADASDLTAARTLVLVENLRYFSALSRRLGVSVVDLAGIIHINEGSAAPGAMARALAITTASATTLCDRLEAAGFIKRSPHPTDRRRRVITLMPRGKRLVERFQENVGLDVRNALSELQQDDWAAVLTFIESIRDRQAQRADEILETKAPKRRSS